MSNFESEDDEANLKICVVFFAIVGVAILIFYIRSGHSSNNNTIQEKEEEKEKSAIDWPTLDAGDLREYNENLLTVTRGSFPPMINKNTFGNSQVERNYPLVVKHLEETLKKYHQGTIFDLFYVANQFDEFRAKNGLRLILTASKVKDLTLKQKTVFQNSFFDIIIAIAYTAYYQHSVLNIGIDGNECLKKLEEKQSDQHESIYIVNWNLEDKHSVFLSYFIRLKHLTILFSYRNASTENIEKLAPYLPVLEELEINWCCLERIPNLKLFPNLKIISFLLCVNLAVDNVKDLSLFDTGTMIFRGTGIAKDTFSMLEKEYPRISFKY